jgi:hypothetical protein
VEKEHLVLGWRSASSVSTGAVTVTGELVAVLLLLHPPRRRACLLYH